jgi:hypothetical protein
MKNFNDTIGNRFRDLPVCSAVPQPLRHRIPHALLVECLNTGNFTLLYFLKPSGFFVYHKAQHSKIVHGAGCVSIVVNVSQIRQLLLLEMYFCFLPYISN